LRISTEFKVFLTSLNRISTGKNKSALAKEKLHLDFGKIFRERIPSVRDI